MKECWGALPERGLPFESLIALEGRPLPMFFPLPAAERQVRERSTKQRKKVTLRQESIRLRVSRIARVLNLNPRRATTIVVVVVVVILGQSGRRSRASVSWQKLRKKRWRNVGNHIPRIQSALRARRLSPRTGSTLAVTSRARRSTRASARSKPPSSTRSWTGCRATPR